MRTVVGDGHRAVGSGYRVVRSAWRTTDVVEGIGAEGRDGTIVVYHTFDDVGSCCTVCVVPLAHREYG